MRRLLLRTLMFALPLGIAVVPAPANAALILTAEPLTLHANGPGSTGRLVVSISSTNGTDLLDLFGVEFRLTSANSHFLSFVNPPADAQLGNASYIFYGDSAADLAGPPSGLVSSSLNPDDTYIGGDGTLSGLGVTVQMADPLNTKLLVLLDITADNGSGVQAGDIFHLTLVRGPSTYFLGPISSVGDPPSLDFEFTNVPITITTVVPEPSSLTLVGVGLLVMGITRVARRDRQR